MRHIQAPIEYEGSEPSLFLAGGITGTRNWQLEAVDALRDTSWIVLNPRRDDFPIDDPSAAEEQIGWEFRHLRRANVVAFWFPPETLCPIALYELGGCVRAGTPLVVGADPNYQRLLDLQIQLRLARPEIEVTTDFTQFVQQMKKLAPMPRALILVDIQNDFLPGGALAVPEGDAILPVVRELLPKFETIVVTQDWHPEGHGSFAANHAEKEIGETIELDGLPQILWPVHCVQGTPGAEFAETIDPSQIAAAFQKGTEHHIDSYSGFFDNGQRKATGLGDWLKERGVTDVYIAGLATDYCVKFTALDAVRLGFNTYLIEDACRGVNLEAGDVSCAIEEMRSVGVRIIDSTDIDGD